MDLSCMDVEKLVGMLQNVKNILDNIKPIGEDGNKCQIIISGTLFVL